MRAKKDFAYLQSDLRYRFTQTSKCTFSHENSATSREMVPSASTLMEHRNAPATDALTGPSTSAYENL